MNQELIALGSVSLASAAATHGAARGVSGKSVADAFSDYLRRELRARKWTVRYLAHRAGVDHSTISRLMQGKRVPTLRTASLLQAAFMGGNPGKLLGITLDPAAAKPVERVAAALKADPLLDRKRASDVLRYYVWMRSAPR